MDFLSILKMSKELLVTNGGLAITMLLIYAIGHRKEHKQFKEYFEHKCTQQPLLFEIKEKIDKYVWKFESEDAKKREALIVYLKNENEILMQKWHVELREYIRVQHDFNLSIEDYTLLLHNETLDIWKNNRRERPLNLSVAELEKINKVDEFLNPLKKTLMWDIAKLLLDPSLNGTRETIIDSCLVKGITYFQNVWKDLLEKEFR